MEFIVLTVLCLIVGFISYETIKYNKQQANESSYKKCCNESNTKKQKPKSNTKVSKVKAQNKRKRKSSKKEN